MLTHQSKAFRARPNHFPHVCVIEEHSSHLASCSLGTHVSSDDQMPDGSEKLVFEES